MYSHIVHSGVLRHHDVLEIAGDEADDLDVLFLLELLGDNVEHAGGGVGLHDDEEADDTDVGILFGIAVDGQEEALDLEEWLKNLSILFCTISV